MGGDRGAYTHTITVQRPWGWDWKGGRGTGEGKGEGEGRGAHNNSSPPTSVEHYTRRRQLFSLQLNVFASQDMSQNVTLVFSGGKKKKKERKKEREEKKNWRCF